MKDQGSRLVEISRKSILTEDTMGLKALREKELALLPGAEKQKWWP